jgi:hypothetical protein
MSSELEKIKTKQEQANNLAIAFSTLMGAKVVQKSEFDKVNKEKEELLEKVIDIKKLRKKLIYTECKLQMFVQYHKQWKPTTRAFGRRLKKLQHEKLYIEFDEYPEDISENLKEAYNCYINGLKMSCYIMILRTIEISANMIYENHNPQEFDAKGKLVFTPALKKLNWIKAKKLIGGADYTLAKAFIEARNDSVHEIFTPTDKQLYSAMETTIFLVNQLKVKTSLST